MLAVPLADVVRVHLTSATTGRPLAFLDTAEDWYGFYHSYARSLHAFGVRRTDMVMAAFSYGPWIGYWSGFYAAQDLGCLVYPVGGLSTEQRLDALLTYPITVLGCTPSYALFLAEAAARKGIDLAKDTKLRITWHTGEPGASIPATRAKIEAAFGGARLRPARPHRDRRLGLRVRGAVGADARARGLRAIPRCSTSTAGPWSRASAASWCSRASIARRCRCCAIARATSSSSPTAAARAAARWSPSRAACWRALDDMKKVRGIIVYPRRIEELVRPHRDVDEFQIVFRRVDGLDDILIRLDPSPALAHDERDAAEHGAGRGPAARPRHPRQRGGR